LRSERPQSRRGGTEIRLGIKFNAAHKDMNCVENEEGEVIYELGKWESTIRKKQKRHKKVELHHVVDWGYFDRDPNG